MTRLLQPAEYLSPGLLVPEQLREEFLARMYDKEFRHAFLDVHLRTSLPMQIRAMREARGWTQGKLGEMAGMPQSGVAKLERTPWKSTPTIETLRRIASAFDVSLIVKFECWGSWISVLLTGEGWVMVPRSFTEEFPV